MAAKPRPAPKRELAVRDDDGRLVALVDLLIERADLGPGAATLVAAGDPIPQELLELPRRARP
jgi:hypothetical protein